MPQTVQFAWQDSETAWEFSAGVSLHSHTMHSEECLSFLPRYLHMAPVISQIVGSYERGPRPVDFARAYWTPPLSPSSALRVERRQIENMDLRALVSLTDHDNIEAGMSLQIGTDPREVPISVEWTVPYERSIFHLGIHNLPPASARHWMSVFTGFTAAPSECLLPRILTELAAIPDVLVVLNHPFWLEEGIVQADHDRALARILRECIASLHAFELNGTRLWKENWKVVELARVHDRPLISGGDRHACEPSACLNLTNASTFSEFVAEVRTGHSTPYFMRHYREPMTLRILEASWDILRPYPGYPGRERWADRIFYRCDDGVTRPLTQVWRDRTPWIMTAPLDALTGFLQLLTTRGLRGPMRQLLAERGGNPALRILSAAVTKLRASMGDLSPEAIALIFTLGLVLGVFPVFGCPTLLCVGVAMAFRLNLPAIQLVNQVCSPLQYALLIPLGRAGARIISAGATAHGTALETLVNAARNAVVGWACLCVPMGFVIYLFLTCTLRRRRLTW